MVLRELANILLFLTFVHLAGCNKQEPQKDTKQETTKADTVLKTDKVNTTNSSSETEKWNPDYINYTNEKFGYSVKYPSNLKKHEENENGSELTETDGFNMKVYGNNNIAASLDELYSNERQKHKDVTYKVKKKNWFVISGYDSEIMFYIKKIMGKDASYTLEITAPSSLRDKYYDVIAVISKSFKGVSND